MWRCAAKPNVFIVAALAIWADANFARASIAVPGFPSSPTVHLWRPVGGIQLVKDYLVGHGVAGLSGWALTTATHISPDGQMFCGWARGSWGRDRAMDGRES